MPRKPVIFIPGFPASELHDVNSGATVYPPSITTLLDPVKKRRFLQEVTTGNLIAGPPVASIAGGIVAEAQSIYNILRDQYGYDVRGESSEFVPIGWDWRQSIASDETLNRVAGALEGRGNVVAIVHSTGGLVLRAFLQNRPQYAHSFEQILAFGVPWAGTFEAVHAMTAGESEGFLFIRISASESASIVSHAQAAYDLLAPAARSDLSWIPADPPHDFMRRLAATAYPLVSDDFDILPVTNVCGWGAATWTSISSADKLGDGTVPLISSSSLRGLSVRTMFLPIGAYATNFLPQYHSQIWSSPPVLQLFGEVLRDRPRVPFICAAADSDEYLDLDRDVHVRLLASAADGSPLPHCVAKFGSSTIAFDGATRAELLLQRAGLHHNIEPDLYRLVIEFQWDGGSAKRPVLIHSV